MRTYWMVYALWVGVLVGFGPTNATADDPKLLVVCSTTQVADFARQVVGDRCRVRSILAAGADPHLYETKPGDAKLAIQADLCLDNGLHLEGKDWMKTLAANAGKPLVTCSDGITPVWLDEHGDVVDDPPPDSRGEKFWDPHAWFSPGNAAVYVNNVIDAVSRMDPAGTQEYRARGELYLDQLRVLDFWIKRQVSVIPPSKRILVTSHDAFNYFCARYGFKSAAPVGWSTGAEIGAGLTPGKRIETVESIRGFGVKAIFVETSVNPKVIRQIAADAGVSIGGELYSDSMGEPGSAGETYIGMMRENVLTIVAALR